MEHAAARAWVETFVAREGYTGQIAFDFIETEAGVMYALECNPRATSGVHLLAAHPEFAAAFFTPPPTLSVAAPPRQARREHKKRPRECAASAYDAGTAPSRFHATGGPAQRRAHFMRLGLALSSRAGCGVRDAGCGGP